MSIHFVKREGLGSDRAMAAVVIRQYGNGDQSTKKPEWVCRLGTTGADDAEIEKILPGFILEFDSLYSNTGGDLNGLAIGVDHFGDPSYSTGAIDGVINETINCMINDVPIEEMDVLGFTGTEAEFGKKLEEIRTILLNRSEADMVEPL